MKTVDQIGSKILELCTEFQNQAYVLITVCCLALGFGLAKSSESEEKTKKRIPAVIVGWIVMCGAITLGAKYGASLKF